MCRGLSNAALGKEDSRGFYRKDSMGDKLDLSISLPSNDSVLRAAPTKDKRRSLRGDIGLLRV